MLSERERSWFADILASVKAIETYTAGMSFEELAADLRTRDAVERRLLIISEAAIRLTKVASELCPGIDWAGFRGMGNRLRHQYDQVDTAIVWNTLKNELPGLAEAVVKLLEAPAGHGPSG